MSNITLKYFFLFLSVVYHNTTNSQDNWRLGINDDWFRSNWQKGLHVGDSMPDFIFNQNNIVNNNTGKTRLSEFKGKLVILDFWNTLCTTCIENFPRMEELQREMGDSIQIFLVNPYETKEQIAEKFQEYYKKKIIMPDLPSIVAESASSNSQDAEGSSMHTLFPIRAVPHHVWIDAKGIIRLRGNDLNTHEAKIRSLLNGDEIFILESSATLPSLAVDGNSKMYKLLGDFESTPLKYGSFITGFNNEIEGGYRRTVVDSPTLTKITQFVNVDLLDVYAYCIGKLNSHRNLIFTPNSIWTDLVRFSDSTIIAYYTCSKLFRRDKILDTDFVKSKICYEQILSINISDEIVRQFILDDLNRYFGVLKASKCVVEKITLKCYALVRTSTNSKVHASPGIGSRASVTTIKDRGREWIKFENAHLSEILSQTINSNKSLLEVMKNRKAVNEAFLIINETGWNESERVNMVLPSNILRSLDDLRKALQSYELDLCEVEREIEFISINKIN